MRCVRRHRGLWLAGALAIGLLVSAVCGQPVNAAMPRAQTPSRKVRSATSVKPRVHVDVLGGPLRFELSPTGKLTGVRREAVRITIESSNAYRLLVRGKRLRQDDGRTASPEHLRIRRSGGRGAWSRLSSEWCELANEPAATSGAVSHVYTFDLEADCAAGASPWSFAGGEYQGGLEFALRVTGRDDVSRQPSTPGQPGTPSAPPPAPDQPGTPSTPPSAPDGSTTPSAPAGVPPTVTTETAPSPSGSP